MSLLASVVIPAHNEERGIGRTLDTLRSGLGPGEVDVVVVCNGCTDATAEVVRREFPDVRVVEIPQASKSDAVAIGNDVAYGLAAAVWTRDLRRAMSMVEKLQAGTVWVNNYRATSFTSPFGGYKRSGLGRESGQEMIKEYLQTKSVWISTAKEVPNPFIMR